MGCCLQHRAIAKGDSNDEPSPPHDRGHADPQLVSSHTSHLSPASQPVRMPFWQSPDALGPEDIRTYQLYLTNERKLATGSIHIAIAALRFIYKVTLKRDWILEEILPLPKKPQKLPVVLSPDEVLHFLGSVKHSKPRVALTTCYAAGLRVSEAARLQPTSIDSKRMVIRVVQGKGQKDRYVMLSPKLLEILRCYYRDTQPKQWMFPGRDPGMPISREAIEDACK